MKKIGIYRAYTDYDNMQKFVNAIKTHSVIPRNIARNIYNWLKTHPLFPPDLEILFDYLFTTYFGGDDSKVLYLFVL